MKEKEMSRINLTVPHKMREKIDRYVEENSTTITSLIHIALTHYFNHLEMKEEMEVMMKGMLKSIIEKKEEEKNVWRLKKRKHHFLKGFVGISFGSPETFKSVANLIKATHYYKK